MTWPTALLLAVLQGLTEFLPVSSSGHLALLQSLLERASGRPLPDALAFDLLVHVGTLLAVIIYFRADLALLPAAFRQGPSADARRSRMELAFIVVAMVPTAIIGLALRNVADHLLGRPLLVSLLVGATGLVLLTTRRRLAGAPEADGRLGWRRALAMGAAQGLAVLPGLSRSGLTIAAGILAGMPPLAAFRMSFLLSVPTIAGAAAVELARRPEALGRLGAPAFGAAAVSAVVALAALAVLARTLRGARFHHFSWYCFAVAVAGIIGFGLLGRP